MRIDIVDVSLALDQSGEPRVNLGDVTTGVGFAAGVAAFGAGDGFVGIPNAADGGGAAPQALMLTQGNLRLCLATRDPRYTGQLGQLGEGDRAIVSACDAGLLLSKGSNKIALKALAQGLSVTLDAAGQRISLDTPDGGIVISPSGIGAAWVPGGGINAEINITSAAMALSFAGPGGACSITLSAAAGGRVDIVAPAGVFVNTIPLSVP